MLQPGTGAITKTTPQVAQLELVFKGPLVKDSLVQTVNDLKLLSTRSHYIGKLVWVNETSTFYYLDGSGDGTEISHWKKQTARVVLPMYDPLLPYQKGDTVHLGGKIYQAKDVILPGQDPASNPTLWLVISGDTLTYRLIFNNTSSVIVYTDIRNPLFEICTGTFQTDSGGNYVIGPDGFISILNPKYIKAFHKTRFDLPALNGLAYEIQFEQDMAPKALTGAINIK